MPDLTSQFLDSWDYVTFAACLVALSVVGYLASRAQPSGDRVPATREQYFCEEHRKPPAIASVQPGYQPVAPLGPLLGALPTTFRFRHPWLSYFAACFATAA
jgi:hypothetical protein